MNIGTVDNQKFLGKAIVVKSSRNRKALKRIANELNKMNLVQDATVNFYMSYGYDTFSGSKCVKVLPKSGGLIYPKDYETLFFKGESATLSLASVISAVKRSVSSPNLI